MEAFIQRDLLHFKGGFRCGENILFMQEILLENTI
jgi:hypothetical protein